MTDLLIAEDDEDIAAILIRMFRRAALTVSRAPDGAAAWEMIIASPPHVVLTDIGMPRLDGWELIHAVHRNERLAETPIAVFSGHLQPGDTRIVEYGACVLLSKPCPNERLVAAVEQLADLGRHRHHGAGAACDDLNLIPG
ncbi:response regulator [Actinoplanes xinjiangensis]|uniref:response regulator n=1 Tax=Actinoplanes xinjiangensis TaxID=512350 RepID=UPI00341CC63D